MTSFKQVADNATSTTSTSLTSVGVTSITLSAGDGTKFPVPGNGFYMTLWNGPSPGSDPNVEKVLVTGRTSDTLTHSATTKTHTSPCNVGLLITAANLADLQVAISALETNTANSVQLAGDIGNTKANPQVTSTHLSTPLPIAQGGTGSSMNRPGFRTAPIRVAALG